MPNEGNILLTECLNFVSFCRDLIVNQVAMSEDERDRIIQEHEKNLAELESRY